MSKNITNVWSRIFDNEYNQIDDKQFIESFSVWKRYYDNKLFKKEELDEWFLNTKQKLNWIITEDSSVLEIGCGNGLISSYLSNKCRKYVGVDNSKICIDKLQLIFNKNKNFTFIKEDADSFQVHSDKFDVIIINSVIQYFPNLEYFIKVIQQSLINLKDDGVIYIGDVRSLMHTWYLERKFKFRYKNFEKFYKKENELLYNTEIFHYLPLIFNKIKSIKIDLKRGYENNELSRYRYDVFIFKKDFIIYNDKDLILYNSFSFKNSRLSNLHSNLSSNSPYNTYLINNFDGSYFIDFDYNLGLDYLRLSTLNSEQNFIDKNKQFLATNKCNGNTSFSSLIKIRESIYHE